MVVLSKEEILARRSKLQNIVPDKLNLAAQLREVTSISSSYGIS
jgi:hypothetical protein